MYKGKKLAQLGVGRFLVQLLHLDFGHESSQGFELFLQLRNNPLEIGCHPYIMRHMCMHKNHGSDQISHPFNHRGIYIYIQPQVNLILESTVNLEGGNHIFEAKCRV